MPGLREAGLLGASVALTGGLAYVIWTYVSSSAAKEQEPQAEPQAEPQKTPQKEAEEPAPSETVVVTAETAAVVEAQNAAATESQPVERGQQVLVLGLEGTGKTSILHCFATGSLEQDVTPTQGFNAVSINREDLHIEFLEIGGKDNLRPYWGKYIPKAMVLVFVVDSSKPEDFPLAKKHLHELIASDPHLPLVVLANKQDLPGACSITELHGALSLSEVGDKRKLFLIGTFVKSGAMPQDSGLQDARDLIIQMVSDSR